MPAIYQTLALSVPKDTMVEVKVPNSVYQCTSVMAKMRDNSTWFLASSVEADHFTVPFEFAFTFSERLSKGKIVFYARASEDNSILEVLFY